jgi:hypothetical protein
MYAVYPKSNNATNQDIEAFNYWQHYFVKGSYKINHLNMIVYQRSALGL